MLRAKADARGEAPELCLDGVRDVTETSANCPKILRERIPFK